jgi:phospholipid/cholesterol/gamma-HCH transport system ATP-binding protein
MESRTPESQAPGSARVFELIDVSKSFGTNVIYENMSLDVRPGETLTILGGSGTGKSVCLKMMIGLLHADSGRILYHGNDVGEMDEAHLTDLRRHVSMVFQGGALFDSMTVLENVGYALVEHTDKSDEEIRNRVIRCLEMVGLGLDKNPHILETMPASLSGGMRKRVALARSIAIEPEVILYDEPTTGLDPPNCDRIGRMIRDLQRELHATSVVVTHDIDTAWMVSDRVAFLSEKRFPFVADVDDFREIDDPNVRDFIEREHVRRRREGAR